MPTTSRRSKMSRFLIRCFLQIETEKLLAHLVEVEMIVSLPLAVALELTRGYVIEVDDRAFHLLTQLKDGWREVCQLTLYLIRVGRLVGIARSEGEEHRRASLGPHLVDKTSDISAEGIDGVL